jgi:hypothetical protein
VPDIATVLNLNEALVKRDQPAVTRWNRLEGRPRTHHFDRALQAEVRDALWMLTRQWQMGEFLGDDAGSPALVRVCSEVTKIDRYQAAVGPIEVFPRQEPLEAKVERRPIPWKAGDQKLSFDLRVAIGRRWGKMLKAAFDAGELTTDYRDAYRNAYPIAVPNPNNAVDAPVCAHVEEWQLISAFAGRVMDGFALFEHIDAPGNAFDNVGADPADEARLTTLALELRQWLDGMIWEPEHVAGAWLPRKLEYKFGCSAPLGGNDLVTRATEYYQGHLDWYALERTNEASLETNPSGGPPPKIQVHTLLPVSLVFSGMPNTRWWEFEDRRTNFGDVKPDTVDLGKLLLLEFGLIYANDWFIFPYTLPLGSITTVRGIAVTNVFGERTWVEAVNQNAATAAENRWSMFQMTSPPNTQPSLVLLPVANKVQEGKSLEEIALVRDEMANMVWAIEKRVTLPSGTTKAGAETAREFFRHLERIVGPPPAPPDPKAAIRYRVMNTVPENWIPFIPVHIEGSSREMQLQRAALPRLLGNDPTNFEKIRPRTTLMREGLEEKPKAKAYFIDEEEVPRAGALVKQAYQRTRWLNGRPFVWLGVKKSTGRGEGSSGLAFDYLAPGKKT